jgi:hypothetical protein|nr:MAG TPA: hypothetical protein [Caudoviricetes sp.]
MRKIERRLIRTRTDIIDGTIIGEVGESLIIVGTKQKMEVVKTPKKTVKMIEEAKLDEKLFPLYNHEILSKYLNIAIRYKIECKYNIDMDTLVEVVESTGTDKEFKTAFLDNPIEEYTLQVVDSLYIFISDGFFLKFKLKSI